MSRADLIRALGAPAELIEADLVDQLADASAALARLRATTPDDPDPAWSRHYSQAQGLYHKALNALLKFRRSPSASAAPPPAAPPLPAASPPPPDTPPPPAPSRLNRQQRRRLDALHRASPERRRQMLASASPRPDGFRPTLPNPHAASPAAITPRPPAT